jgi:hypothetical protein
MGGDVAAAGSHPHAPACTGKADDGQGDEAFEHLVLGRVLVECGFELQPWRRALGISKGPMTSS